MNIYKYSKITKEYLSIGIAEADPEETKLQGEFVPLVPADATLKEIPSYNQDNQIPVFEYDNWVVKSDYRKNYYKVDENLNVLNIDTIGEQEGIIVDKATGEDIKENKDWYKIVDNEVVKKTDKEYQQEQAEKRKVLFNQEFFQTSLGYIRRKVNMATGETKDFLCDLVPAMTTALTQDIATPIITYKEPDFTQEATLEYMESLQEVKQITADFLQECALQLSKDFLPTPLTIEVTQDETEV